MAPWAFVNLRPVVIQVFSLTALPYDILTSGCCVKQGSKEKAMYSPLSHGVKPWELRLPRVPGIPAPSWRRI